MHFSGFLIFACSALSLVHQVTKATTENVYVSASHDASTFQQIHRFSETQKCVFW